MNHCINDNEQQMFSVLTGYWQHINWQLIGDLKNLEKFKNNDIEGFLPTPQSEENGGESITKVFILGTDCSFIEQTQ